MALEPASTTQLVGRVSELTRLVELIGLPSAGMAAAGMSAARGATRQGRVVLMGGDAGVGKTRLLTELHELARAAGWRVLLGHCLDFGDSALAYLPFSEAFGRLAAQEPALVEQMLTTVPGVARLMPGRRMLSQVSPEQRERLDRADLFEAVHSALGQVAASSPVLLVIEDVHWADQSTRELLTFLCTRQFSGPISIVVSYRSDDLHRRHPLRPTIAEWSRLPGVSRLSVHPLADADIRSLVRELHPGPLREADLQGIVERAEGNAFFTEELVAATGRAGTALPTDLADLLLVRLDQLDDIARAVVRAASVAGRQVPHALLDAVVRLGGGELDQALRSAVDSNVLVAVGTQGYGFRHALLAEAVYHDLLPGERVRFHSAYVSALDGHQALGTAAELARHALAAHDVVTAVRASVQAGDEAMDLAAPDEAAAHYERALGLLSHGDDSGADTDTGTAVGAGPRANGVAEAAGCDVVELTLKTSEALLAAGQPFRALALAQQELAQQSPGVVTPAGAVGAAQLDRARLLMMIAGIAVVADTSVDAVELSTEALHLVPADPPSELRARLLAVQARATSDRRRDQDAARWAREAQRVGRELNLPDVVADATTTLARVEGRAGDPEASRRSLDRAIAQAEAAQQIAGQVRGMFNLARLHYEVGDLTDALTVFREAASRAQQHGRTWAPYGLDSRVMMGVVAYVSGAWDAVGPIVDVTGQSPPAMAEAALTAVGLAVAAGRGEHSAVELLPGLRPWWQRDGLIALHSGSAAIDLHGDHGDLAAAWQVHDDLVGQVTDLWQQPHFDARIRLSALMLGQLCAQVARSGTVERAELARAGDALVADTRPVLDMHRHLGPEGVAWSNRLSAEHLRLGWLTGVEPPSDTSLVSGWQQTVAAFESFGHVFEVARSRARLAAALRATGHFAQATEVADLARRTAESLGARPLSAELGSHPAPAGGPGRGETPRTETLTAREQQVLTLVAQGQSNRQIARQLYISDKTVSVHVSNILAKLGAAGRTEAAALARRRGLLPDGLSEH